eukprot:749300-Hanusia_phi.AAC.12
MEVREMAGKGEQLEGNDGRGGANFALAGMSRSSNREDWHEQLIEAAQARYRYAVRMNHRNQNCWRDAVHLLEGSRKRICLQKGGQNAGVVVGLPAKLAPTVVQVLTRIVKGDEEVVLREHRDCAETGISEDSVVRRRRYRDSAYAILAALWLEYEGPEENPQPTIVVQRRAQKFTDNPMEYDWRSRAHGAWKAKDDLVKKKMVREFVGMGNGGKSYSLTSLGARACFYIFNEMFHPKVFDQYALVEPRNGFVDRNGNFVADEGKKRRAKEEKAARYSSKKKVRELECSCEPENDSCSRVLRGSWAGFMAEVISCLRITSELRMNFRPTTRSCHLVL